MAKLPSISYTIAHSLDRLRRQADYIEEEILMGRLLAMGHPDVWGAATGNGIVSMIDPSSVAAGATEAQLGVSESAVTPLNIDVYPGIVMFRSGVWIYLHDAVRQIGLADQSVGVPNVIVIHYELDTAPDEPNYYNDLITPYTVRVGDPLDDTTIVNAQAVLIESFTIESYEQLSQSVRDDYVVLCVATVQEVQEDPLVPVTTTQVSIDMTRDSYSYNRPWFSTADVAHRARTDNPHDTNFANALVGDLYTMQMFLDHGVVLGKDRDYPKVPGYRCSDTVVQAHTDDAAGTLTGYPNAKYFELGKFPVRVGKVWGVNTGTVLAALHVPGTNRLVFPFEDPPTEYAVDPENVTVYYTRVEAGEPNLAGNDAFRTQGPATNELLVAGGRALTQLASTEENFADSKNFPMRYEMFADGDAALIKTPQVVYCWKLLEDLGASDTPEIESYGPGRIMMGMNGAAQGTVANPLSVKIKVTGTDEAGATIDETFEYNDTNWAPLPVLPVNPDPTFTAVHFGAKTFATITLVERIERLNDGPLTGIIIWLAQTPFSNPDKMRDALHLATVDWTGYSMGRVFDQRVVTPTVPDYLEARATAEANKFNVATLAAGNRNVYVEDFRRPRYASLEHATEAEDLGDNYLYPSYSTTKWQPGVVGFYESIGFPAEIAGAPTNNPGWRVTLFGMDRNAHDPSWFDQTPQMRFFSDISMLWSPYTNMIPVPGLPGTFTNSQTSTPFLGVVQVSRVQVRLRAVHATGMVVYGGEWA